jgi:hypothetical protein
MLPSWLGKRSRWRRGGVHKHRSIQTKASCKTRAGLMISPQCLEAQVLGLGVILLLSLRFAAPVPAHYSHALLSLRSSRFFSFRDTAMPEAHFRVR